MYVNYHLDPSKVTVVTIKGDCREFHKIGETSIHMDAGQPVLTIDNGRWKTPPADLADKIIQVSIKHVMFEYGLDRVPGLYRLGKAEGYVARTVQKEYGVGIMAEVTAPTKEEALTLWDAILRGDIRPHEEHRGQQIEPLIDDDTLQEVRHQAALLARKILKEEMLRLTEAV